VPDACSAVVSSSVLALLSLLPLLLLAMQVNTAVSRHHIEDVGVNTTRVSALSRGGMLPGEQRTPAPPRLLLGMPTGEGARRGQAQGPSYAQQAARK